MSEPSRQFPFDVLAVPCHKELTPLDKLVLVYLRWRQGPHSTAWPSLGRIAADLQVHKRAALRSVNRLVAAGLVEKDQGHAGRGHASEYHVLLQKRRPGVTFSHATKSDPLSPEKGTSSTRKSDRMSPPSEQYEQKENERHSHTAFLRPTVEEVRAYAEGIGYALDAARFCDYYAANGWRVGGAPMRDWRAVVRNWQRRDAERAGTEPEDANDPDDEGGQELLAKAAAVRRALEGAL